MSFINTSIFKNMAIKDANKEIIVTNTDNNNLSFHSSTSNDNVDTMSIGKILNKASNMDLEICSFNNNVLTPVLKINNSNQNCVITQNLNMSSKKIINLADPDDDGDAVNLSWFNTFTPTDLGDLEDVDSLYATRAWTQENTPITKRSYEDTESGLSSGDSQNNRDVCLEIGKWQSISTADSNVYPFTKIHPPNSSSGPWFNYVQDSSTTSYLGWAWGSDVINEIDSNKNSLFYGNVGIGAANPSYKLHVAGDIQCDSRLGVGTPYSHSSWSGGLKYPLYVGDARNEPSGGDYTSNVPYYIWMGQGNSTGNFGYGSNNPPTSISARFNGRIWISNTIYHTSDSRIKTNIVDVPDNLALEQLRTIPCRYYEYIDKLKRGSDKTIGFIAQEVKSIMPMAVSQEEDFIPNVFKVINCTWNSVNDKFSMSSTDLPNVSGILYKFYASNSTNASDASDEKEIILIGNSDNTFTFTTQYTNVFCYGSEVNDLNIVDKNKLFTLNFSATQEIDRIQQTHITEIASLKTTVSNLENKNIELENKINDLYSIINELKTKI